MPSDRRGEDRKIILEEDYPNWPILPLKRRVEGQNWPEVAFINALGAMPPKLHMIFANMWAYQELTRDERAALKIEIYDDADQLLDDGWEVD